MRLLTCFALLILVLSLGASAVGRDEIKVYLVVGDWDTTYGEQIWRCNVDGTEPELVLDYTDFAPITAVALDDLTQRMVVDVGSLHSYTLDGTDMQYISQPSRSYSGQCMDSQSGYLSYLEGDNKTVTTELVSGGMVGSFDVRDLPVPFEYAEVRDVDLCAFQGSSATESTSWGRLKADYRSQ